MKRIFWLTSDSFYDTDSMIVEEIAKQHCVDWHIFLGYNNHYSEDAILATPFPKTDYFKVIIHKTQVRARNPKRIFEYLKLIKKIRKGKYDVVYIDMIDLSYLFPLLYIYRVKNIVYACHDVVPHIGYPNIKLFSLLQNFIFKWVCNFHIFSKEQYKIFKNKYPAKNVLLAGMALKDFGVSDQNPPSKKIVFTYFGMIRENKGLEYLIEAGNKLYETHQDKFIVNIFGYGEEWYKYEMNIRHFEAFNLDIRNIANEEIPDIFCSSHFLVLPYKDVTQSGPLLIAYNYNVPVIASNFSGFREYINDKENGFLFGPSNIDSLINVMENAIINYDKDYFNIKSNLAFFVKENLSKESIAEKYIYFFNKMEGTL